MEKTPLITREAQIRYLQQTLRVSRRELIETIRLSHISLDRIVNYVQTKNHRDSNVAGIR